MLLRGTCASGADATETENAGNYPLILLRNTCMTRPSARQSNHWRRIAGRSLDCAAFGAGVLDPAGLELHEILKLALGVTSSRSWRLTFRAFLQIAIHGVGEREVLRMRPSAPRLAASGVSWAMASCGCRDGKRQAVVVRHGDKLRRQFNGLR